MGGIWFLSDQPDLGTGLEIDLLLRKLAHMAVFGTLLLAWWWAAGPRTAVVVTLAWAILDEVHQSWVRGRHGAVYDVAIDALGMGLAAALAVWWLRRARSPARRDRAPSRDLAPRPDAPRGRR
jgi:VanZ family protein